MKKQVFLVLLALVIVTIACGPAAATSNAPSPISSEEMAEGVTIWPTGSYVLYGSECMKVGRTVIFAPGAADVGFPVRVAWHHLPVRVSSCDNEVP